ncbi:MAG: sensor histidine kinase, partial [Actinomycetota bacterium]|nr:sensor histidine kinase [Actinomycetota bacterium]
SWIRRLKSVPIDEDQARYVVAHRLLDELRVVSRRLSSGLDAVLLSTTLLGDCLARVTDGRGAVLVRTDGGVFVSLAQHLGDVTGDVANDPLVMQCWTTAVPAHQAAIQDRHPPAVPHANGERDPGSTTGRTRWALPVRVGTRMVGVLALDVGQPLDAGLLIELQALLDERALPLDAALLFDEVRAIATVEERHRLAREIHDGVAQEIASLGYLVDDLAFGPDAARAAGLAHLRAELTRIVDDLRLSIFDLRSQVSRTTGLGSVLAEYLREVGSRSGTAVHLTLDETPDRLQPEIEEQLLRIVQEAVTNARKHSGADNLWVSCRVRPPAASLVVEDDGSGVAGVGGADGFGLSIMRERAQRIGATLTITARAGGGTRVTIRLHAPRDTGLLAPDEPAATRPPPVLGHSTTRAVAHG